MINVYILYSLKNQKLERAYEIQSVFDSQFAFWMLKKSWQPHSSMKLLFSSQYYMLWSSLPEPWMNSQTIQKPPSPLLPPKKNHKKTMSHSQIHARYICMCWLLAELVFFIVINNSNEAQKYLGSQNFHFSDKTLSFHNNFGFSNKKWRSRKCCWTICIATMWNPAWQMCIMWYNA